MSDSVRIISYDVFGDRQWTEWNQPLEVLTARSAEEVCDVIRRVDQANAADLYALGFVTYEAGSAFDDRFRIIHQHATLPYAWFALFQKGNPYKPPRPQRRQDIQWTPTEDDYMYRDKINRIKDHIASGETYQVNHTFQLETLDSFDAEEWFSALYRQQPSPYAMLIETQGFSVVSMSPELFFRLEGNRITCEPMKGTCPRGPHAAVDQALGRELEHSRKNRAENVMITDMVRNDLGRLPNAGSVRVEELFKVTPWPTLWQMTSRISAETNAGLFDIFKALFPSASITGAPKLQTSSIIAELEDRPRGLYTGAVGWSAPGGRNAQFSVAIRTAVRHNRTGITRYGIGSGIVWDSDADSEYQECILKSRLLSQANESFSLLETMRWDRDAGYRFLDRHFDRLTDAAAYYSFPVNRASAQEQLEHLAGTFTMPHMRVRLLADRDGKITLEQTELTGPAHYDLPASAQCYTARIDSKRTMIDSSFLYHKTTNRLFYDEAKARNPDVDEVLLVNIRGEIMEFSAGNIVIRRNDQWLTPRVESGLLAGVLRSHLIDSGQIAAVVLSVADIKTADEIYFINSVRGWVRVKLVD